MKKLFTLAAAFLFGMSAMAVDYEWETIPGTSFHSGDNAVVVRSTTNLSYEQKQMASDDATNKLWGIKIGSSANTNIDTSYVEIDCTGTITALELGVSNTSTSAGVKYAVVFCGENTFNSADQTALTAVEATSINRSVTSDNHQTITVPEGAQSLRIYRKVRVSGIDYGAGSSVDIYYLNITIGAATVRYTVTYMDGETVLGTEKVVEGESPVKHADFEAKAHATFDGWFNEAACTSAADFTAAITADKAFYGKWTAEAFNASTSVNIEQGVLDNGKTWNFTSAFDAAHITYDAKGNTDELDSLNSSKTANNEPYLGLKIKKKDAYIEVALNSGDALKVKLGAVAADFKVSVDGVESTLTTSAANSVYELTASKAEYVRFFIATDGKTVVFKQIMINEPIAAVAMPGNETNTKLASLTLNGTAIAGFAGNKTEYNITLPDTITEAPVVAATAEGVGATISAITQATAIPGTATFTVTAADGTTAATYTINFSHLSGAKVLTNVKFSNGAYGAIDEDAHTVTVAYMGTMPTADEASIVVSEAASVAVTDVITVTAEDGTTQAYTIVGHELVASATVDEEITFNGAESYIYAHYGFDAEKGVKFAKAVDEASNMRIAKGNTRIYMALPAAAEVVLTSGTGGARNVKIYVNGEEYTGVTKTAASGEHITIELSTEAASFLMIESNQTGGDGGFTKMQLNSTVTPTSVENIQAEKAEKVMINGQLYIIKNGVRYNAMGAVVE